MSINSLVYDLENLSEYEESQQMPVESFSCQYVVLHTTDFCILYDENNFLYCTLSEKGRTLFNRVKSKQPSTRLVKVQGNTIWWGDGTGGWELFPSTIDKLIV